MTMQKVIPVDFRGDVIWAVDDDGAVFIAVKPIAERLGLSWGAQYRRLQRDAVLSKGISIMAIPSPGGAQDTVCLPLDFIPGFLFGLDERRVKPELREKVVAYKRECHRVLYDRFFGQGAEGQGPDEAPPFRRVLLPGHPDFSQAVRLVREARLTRGTEAALAIWRVIGLPWVPELEAAAATGRNGEPTDSVAQFAVDGIERAPGVSTPAAALWQAYSAFCTARGLENLGERSFLTRFASIGFAKRKSMGRSVYLNIRPVVAAGERAE